MAAVKRNDPKKRPVPQIEKLTKRPAAATAPKRRPPRDNPDRIDYAKLTRMTRWMYLTGWIVANGKERPAIDAGFQLER